MAGPPPAVQAESPEWEAIYGVLTGAADIAADDGIAVTEVVLEAGAYCECQVWNQHSAETVQRVLRQVRYQIASAVAIPPHDMDDPLIAVVIEVLARHPIDVQARVLRAAADRHTRRPGGPD